MSFLDIFLILLGIIAGIGAFISGSGALYKLFLGLIIGFLLYLVISYQIEIAQFLSPALLNGYQSFLTSHTTGVLSFALISIPLLGILFMLHPKLSITTNKRSVSQLLLGLLLPIFLIGILAHLAEGSLLSENNTWKNIFTFFEGSGLYQIFQKLPGTIFFLLIFLIFYKSIFLLLSALLVWIWKEILSLYFRNWREKNISSRIREEME